MSVNDYTDTGLYFERKEEKYHTHTQPFYSHFTKLTDIVRIRTNQSDD